jgi:hypothetical protein
MISGKVPEALKSRGAFRVKALETFRIVPSALWTVRPVDITTFQDDVRVITKKKKKRDYLRFYQKGLVLQCF